MSLAVLDQSRIDTRDVAVEQCIKAAGPGVLDPMAGKLTDELRCVIVCKSTKWPAGKVDVDVDDHVLTPFAASMGASIRCKFLARINRLAASGISAP